MAEPIIPTVVDLSVQKDAMDCGVACLKMLLGVPYVEARAASPKRVGKEGMTTRQLMNAAKRLGARLVPDPNPDLDEDTGILDLSRDKAHGSDGHFALLLKGVLINPANGEIWSDVESYLKGGHWVVNWILKGER